MDSIAILLVGKDRARAVRFRVEMSGEADWPLSVRALVEAVQRVRPDMIAVVEDESRALALAEELRRQGQADTVILLHPDPATAVPSQQHIVLPRSVDPADPKDLVRNLARALVEAQSKGLVNPLTGMPGAAVLREEVERRLLSGQILTFLYIDLDNFKSYNDYYGFAKGDEVIKLLSDELKLALDKHGARGDLGIHIGGDDFGVLTEPQRSQPIADALLSSFDTKVPWLYEEKERLAGYIVTQDRRGNEARFPLMTLSIAGVSNQHRQVTGYLQLSEIAAEMKGYAKLIPGSSYVQDRRRD